MPYKSNPLIVLDFKKWLMSGIDLYSILILKNQLHNIKMK